jgi:membrane associated rhomboid family serine protease
MGYEDREYYRESDSYQGGGSMPGFSFDRQSIITTLIIINVAIFLLDAFTPRVTAYDMIPNLPDDPTAVVDLGDGQLTTVAQLKAETLGHWLSDTLALKAHRPWEIWAYLTHGFAHASISSKTGIFHVGFNMLTLFFLGKFVEHHLGRAEFLKFYLVSIVVGGAVWLLIQMLTGGQGSIVGASGAVSAVVVYFIFLMPNARLLLMGVIPVPAWGVGVMFLVNNLYYAFTASQIAWEAHLAGGAFGMAYHLLNWNFSRVQMPDLKRSKLKIHQPAGIDPKLQSEADRILEKISQQGESSLSRAELKTLNKYSKLIRKQRG